MDVAGTVGAIDAHPPYRLKKPEGLTTGAPRTDDGFLGSQQVRSKVGMVYNPLVGSTTAERVLLEDSCQLKA